MKADTLKKSILQWAIEGKLVPQLESEPGVEQIGEVPEDVPFAIPEKWKWVLFSDAIKVISSRPFQIKAKEVLEQGLYPVISQSKEQIDGYSNDDKKLIPDSELPIIIFGDHTRTLKYVDFRFVVGADGTKLLHVKTSSIDPKYFYIALQSMIGQTRQRGYSRHFQFLKVLHIPIPPIEEQRRIVAKLNELLPLVESYGKEQEALENVEKEFPDKLRASLLQEAIQGKLVPQLESEPEVEQIGEAPEDVPFAIPEKWKWVLFSDAIKVISSRPFQIKAKEVLEQGLYPVISQSKEQIDGYSNDDKKLIPDSELPIIIFGDHTRTLKYVDFRFVVGADGTKLLHVKTSSIDPKYFYIALQSMIGQTRQRGYSRHFQFLKVLHIPIPPIEEQRRIVAKLNELLNSTSQLERTISTP